MRHSAYIFIAACITVLFGCNKYEEGSNFTLLTAKSRLVNTWSMRAVESTYNGTTADVTVLAPQEEIVFRKSGGYSRILTTSTQTESENGTWVFTDNQTAVTLTAYPNGDPITYELVRLKNKSMKWRYADGATIFEVEFTGK